MINRKAFIFTVLLGSIIELRAQLPCNVLVGYWQTNWGKQVRLKDINSNYNVINIAFLEAGGGDGNHDNNSVSALKLTVTDNANLLADIPVVQNQGKKVLISIGGATGSFKLSSTSDITTFVEKVKTIIQTYGLDGLDLDLERSIYLKQVSGGTISNPEVHIANMISALQQLLAWYQTTYSKKMILTLVPEVAYTVGGLSNYMSNTYGASYLPIIEALKNDIDLVMVQLYNASGGSYGLDNAIYYHGTVDFILSQTEAMIKGFTCKNGKGVYSGLKPAQVAVCLPAQTKASTAGYISPSNVSAALNYLRGVGPKPGSYTLQKAGGYPDLGGMATWSINLDADSAYVFANNFQNIFPSCLTTSIEEKKETSLKIYPNPARNQINVEIANSIGQVIKIYTVSGQLVLQKTIESSSIIIDISELSVGFYHIQIGTTSKKIIVE